MAARQNCKRWTWFPRATSHHVRWEVLTSQKSSWALKSMRHVGLKPLWPESSFCASPLTHPACQTQRLGDWEWALFLGAQEPLAPSRSLLNQFFTRNVRFQGGHVEWASGGM